MYHLCKKCIRFFSFENTCIFDIWKGFQKTKIRFIMLTFACSLEQNKIHKFDDHLKCTCVKKGNSYIFESIICNNTIKFIH